MASVSIPVPPENITQTMEPPNMTIEGKNDQLSSNIGSIPAQDDKSNAENNPSSMWTKIANLASNIVSFLKKVINVIVSPFKTSPNETIIKSNSTPNAQDLNIEKENTSYT